MAEKIFVGDTGTRIEVTLRENGLPVDISAATSTQFIFSKPDNTDINKNASFITDGTDGKLEYFSENDVFTVGGRYKLQVSITTPTGSWKSDIKTFPVYRVLA